MGVPVALTASMVAEATSGRVVTGAPSRVFAGVCTDTRTLTPGSLFIALRGERFDAHDYLGAAVKAGATGLVVEAAPAEDLDVVVIVVPDSLLALQALAHAIRRASAARVIAITGSAGKTTTKEVTAALLALGGFDVFRNAGNLNNHIGLPLSLTRLTAGFDLAVVELGMNHVGEIRTLVAIAEPDVRVWTNVGDAHLGHFGSREAVADAKAEILEGADANTLLIVNADDPLVRVRTEGFVGRTVTFGESPDADVRATQVVDRGFDGVDAHVTTRHGETDVSLPLPGRIHLSNVLAAVAVATELGVALDVIAPGLATLRPVARRGASVVLPTGVRVVDDSYNASPAAVDATLDALRRTPVRGRRVAVIGEMLELGSASAALHEACGRAAARAGVDVLIVIGGAVADALADAAVLAGLEPGRVHRFADSATAAAAVDQLVMAGDVVLVKGSRGTRTDLVVDHLMAVA